MRSPVIERLMVRGSQVALKHVIHDLEARTLVMELRRRAIKRWVPCGDMDRRLKIPHSAKVECEFRTTPEECIYHNGPIGPSVQGLIIQYNTIQYNTCIQMQCLKHLRAPSIYILLRTSLYLMQSKWVFLKMFFDNMNLKCLLYYIDIIPASVMSSFI